MDYHGILIFTILYSNYGILQYIIISGRLCIILAQYRCTWQADDAPEAYRLAAQARKQHEMDSNPKRIDISVLNCLSILHIIFPFLKGIKFTLSFLSRFLIQSLTIRQRKWHPGTWQHSFVWGVQAWNWAGRTHFLPVYTAISFPSPMQQTSSCVAK